MSEVIRCTFTSVWDDGSEVTTNCTLDPSNGQVHPETSDAAPEGSLEREYITLDDGNEVNVCMACHSYILKPVVGDRADLSYGEYQICSDPECTN
jgi:hypothetical protein